VRAHKILHDIADEPCNIVRAIQTNEQNKRTNKQMDERTNNELTTQLAANMSQISGLTFDSLSEDDDAIILEPPTAAAAAANLPPSTGSVWEHPLVEVIKVPLLNGLGNQKTTWKCLAPGCCKEWSGANSSKALAHGSRDNKFCLQVHVKACKGSASQAEIDLFCSLLKNRERKTAVKRAHDLISEDIVSSQGTVSDGILQKREKSRGGGSGGFAAAKSSLSRNADEGTSGAGKWMCCLHMTRALFLDATVLILMQPLLSWCTARLYHSHLVNVHTFNE
jgi:hypothetical protein